MKTIKILLWLIILTLLGTFIFQNRVYFMTNAVLELNLTISSWHWTLPELPNIAYMGICFLLGLILVAFKAMLTKFRLKKEIKLKEGTIASLKEEINTLKTELEVFQHDPYIKNNSEEKSEENSEEIPVVVEALPEALPEIEAPEDKPETDDETVKEDEKSNISN